MGPIRSARSSRHDSDLIAPDPKHKSSPPPRSSTKTGSRKVQRTTHRGSAVEAPAIHVDKASKTNTTAGSASEKQIQPTTTTLLIDRHPFTTPHDPVQAFHATRAQTIAFLRAVSGGAAEAQIRDLSLPAAPDGSGSTREISIDNQTFTIPAGAVPAFLATREMTIASFRHVTEGRAGARDMAFVFGTAAETTPEHSSQNALTRIDSRAGTLTSAVPCRRAEDDATPATPTTAPTAATTRTLLKLDSASLNSRNTFLGNFHDIEHAQRELGMNKSWCRGKYIDGLLSLGWGFAETRELVRIDRFPMPKPMVQFQRPPARVSNELIPVESAKTRECFFNLKRFLLGQFFRDIAHVRRELNMGESWCRGKYIEGLISLGGIFAETREVVGEVKCSRCILSAERHGVDVVCRVLVGEDPRVTLTNQRCGFCAQRSILCNVEEDLED
ncbi:uncharacterized protein H6S33_008065 [Morchella sextelata]|uniref:uncharacterized protein n=1 Tax=Morchella sextelata TaxID=1174677 RepID=UPI001D039EEA|nr:uncharacterized protein H6S33_008065 [Morchella sextelata]KAH0603061.1 hypothetical protein H6S33_008065 [Morchella sextelata]